MLDIEKVVAERCSRELFGMGCLSAFIMGNARFPVVLFMQGYKVLGGYMIRHLLAELGLGGESYHAPKGGENIALQMMAIAINPYRELIVTFVAKVSHHHCCYHQPAASYR